MALSAILSFGAMNVSMVTILRPPTGGVVEDGVVQQRSEGRDGPVRGRPPMTERRRSQQRLELSRQAVRLFAQQGVAATSGEQIAEAVGLSVRTLWRYFPTKESCVEPVLSASLEHFTDVLRSWPAGLTLAQYLDTRFGDADIESAADAEAILQVLRLAQDEPEVRAVWLLVNQRSEAVLAEILAARSGRSADELEVRVQAATVNVALRIATEDRACRAAEKPSDSFAEYFATLMTAMEVAVRVMSEDGTVARRRPRPTIRNSGPG
jgi:AcrR family transcriptional regulator